MTALVISTAATWAMIGLIWTMQVVHYPMLMGFSAIQPGTAVSEHQRRITLIVGPLMAAEGLTALVLLVSRPSTMGALSAWLAAALLGIALLSTVLVQVPLHSRLASGHDADAAQRLISGNWVRTAVWTGRGVLLAAVLAT